jgi:hypothetical protein
MWKHVLLPGLMSLAMLFTGCATVMQPVSKTAESYRPADNEATIIFLRSTSVLNFPVGGDSQGGCGIRPSVFDVTGEETKFLGKVLCYTQLAYKTNTGEHMFMIVGESADFLRTNLGGGKTYYAVVIGWPGWLYSRFSLNPVQRHEQNQEGFQANKNTFKFVENTPESYAWAAKHAAGIEKKRDENMPRWLDKYGTNTFGLTLEDGM